MSVRVVVTPYNPHPVAVAATVRTLEALPMAGFVHTETRDGLIFGTARVPAFLAFACEQQGYAEKVEEFLDACPGHQARGVDGVLMRYDEPSECSYEPLSPSNLYSSATATSEGREAHARTVAKLDVNVVPTGELGFKRVDPQPMIIRGGR